MGSSKEPLEKIRVTSDVLAELRDNIAVATKGKQRLVITDKEGVQQVKAYWLYLHEEVSKRHKKGMSAPDAAYQIVLSQEFTQQPFANWNSPERIMVSTHTLYRHLDGRTDSPKIPELLNIMRKQALLAHELPKAQPSMMRKT